MKRVLLKLSGEALQGQSPFGIDSAFVQKKCQEILDVQRETGVQIALVIGGGNIFRGKFAPHMDRNRADAMGMLATTLNAAALKDAFLFLGGECEVLSAIDIPAAIGQSYTAERAKSLLEQGSIVILAWGTGNPFFSTDSAAALRALELGCDTVFKATKVDGVYDKDPKKHPDARRYTLLTSTDALQKQLSVLDMTAFALCREGNMPLRVYDFHQEWALKQLVLGDTSFGTLVVHDDTLVSSFF